MADVVSVDGPHASSDGEVCAGFGGDRDGGALAGRVERCVGVLDVACVSGAGEEFAGGRGGGEPGDDVGVWVVDDDEVLGG